jgi:competence protein ComEC
MRLAHRFRTEFVLLAFAAGVVIAQYAPELPPRIGLIAAFATFATLAVALTLFGTFARAARPLTIAAIALAIAIGVGGSYALLRADWRMSNELPRAWEGRDIEIVGVIDEMPQRDERGIRFAFRVEQVLTSGAQVPARIALGWYKPTIKELAGETLPELHAGERWRWSVRLKRPHGYVNPAGFDLEAWMLERNLRATGSVQVDEPVKRLSVNAGTLSDRIERLRERIRERMLRALDGRQYAGVLVALAIGDQQAIRDTDWSLFNATGVSHLLSISGAHVTLFAAWVGWLVMLVWRRSPTLSAKLPAQKAAALSAAIVALAYAALTGFAVPAQRTCYMLLTLAVALMLSRNLSSWLVLCWALVVVLAIDSWAALSAGFWFSFSAVALLIYVTQSRVQQQKNSYVALKTQLAVTLGLAPIALAFFQQVSIVGPIANAVAIPAVTLVVVPITLLWLLIPIDALLSFAHVLIEALVALLQWLASLTAPMWSQHAPPLWAVILATCGILWLLAPRLVPHRWIGAVWCLPLFAVVPPSPSSGEFRVTILDIGQGTAVVVRTQSHTLVYDTGPRWGDASDAGSRLIAPYLRASGAGKIDGLVVSHLDLDHSGGAKSLLREVPTTWLLTSMFEDAEVIATAKEKSVAAFACVAGQRWHWDEVLFEVLHPTAESYAQGKLKTNDRSCVIKVSSHTASMLLTGDIETTSEAELVKRDSEKLRVDALLIPHHGSTTSSTDAFLDAVAPTQAFINAGYRNRFGHPRDTVLARYASRKISVHRTDWHGAITVESKDRFMSIHRERDRRKRYWIDRPDTADVRPIE